MPDRPLLTGPAAEWLASRRDDLNRRFAMAHKRFPALDRDTVLLTLAEVLPPLAEPAPGSDALLSSVYDLVLLHAGRGAFASRPGLDLLLRLAFPALRPLLLRQPRTLPAALSNAVENLGARGEAFARALPAVGVHLCTADTLLQAGGVLAWRLGEARLRRQALELAPTLPPAAVLAALDLDWPPPAAPGALACLRLSAWQHPRELLRPETVVGLAVAPPQEVESLVARIGALAPPPLARWRPVARVGAFAGFGGEFVSPPEVLPGGDEHRFSVRAGSETFGVDADLFGWVARPAELPLAEPRRVRPPRLLQAVQALLGDEPLLAADGSFSRGGEQARLAELAGASTYAFHPRALVAAFPDSHRLRVAAPWWGPV